MNDFWDTTYEFTRSDNVSNELIALDRLTRNYLYIFWYYIWVLRLPYKNIGGLDDYFEKSISCDTVEVCTLFPSRQVWLTIENGILGEKTNS